MKKLILIPTALITSLTPVISLVGCGNKPEPEPEDLEKYKVTEQEMEDAISLTGCEYLQITSLQQKVQGETTFVTNLDRQYSPNICHALRQSTDSYSEWFDVHENDSYVEYSRFSPEQEEWDVDPIDAEDFPTIQDAGEQIYSFYESILFLGGEFEFDETDKSYIARTSGETTNEVRFYFLDKKMIKFDNVNSSSSSDFTRDTSTFAYEQITPTPPGTFNLTEYAKSTDPYGFQFYCEGANLSPEVTYTVNIDTEPHASEITGAIGWEFGILDDVWGTPSSDIATASVVIDNTPQTKVEPTDYLGENEFTIRSFDAIADYLDGGTNLNGNHKITINFTVNEEIENKDLVFIIV